MSDPLLIGSMRRWPRGEVVHTPGLGIGKCGTSAAGFLREYDEAIAEIEQRSAVEALAELDHLRAELARRDEQIAAVRALHGRMVHNENVCDTCTDRRGLYLLWPCPTLRALDGGAS